MRPQVEEESKGDNGNNRPDGEDSNSETEGNQDQNYHFYKEYCRLYYANIILTNRLQQLLNEKQDLNYKLTTLEVSHFSFVF